MRAGQHADFDRDRTDVLGAAAVGPLAPGQDLGADEVLLERLEQLGDLLRIRALLGKFGNDCLAQVTRGVFAATLVRVVDSCLELAAKSFLDLFLQLFVDRRRRGFLLRLARQLAQLLLCVDERLHGAVAGHDRFEDHVLWQLMCACLDHQHRIARTGHRQLEL